MATANPSPPDNNNSDVTSDPSDVTAAESTNHQLTASSLFLNSSAITNVPFHRTWDPEDSPDWDAVTDLGTICLKRIKNDIVSSMADPPPGILIVPDENRMTVMHALVSGPFDTPYEGGHFYFKIRCGPSYPSHPPRVKLITTSDNTVRFNPNLYASGKVCLSVLNTWSGPGWSPALTFASVLLSIQSLMSEKPYFNEPGYSREKKMGDSKRYNEIIRHETIRVAVIETLEKENLPGEFLNFVKKSFPTCYDFYENILEENLSNDGMPMQDPFGTRRKKFCYKSLLERLKALKEKYKSYFDHEKDEMSDAELSDLST